MDTSIFLICRILLPRFDNVFEPFWMQYHRLQSFLASSIGEAVHLSILDPSDILPYLAFHRRVQSTVGYAPLAMLFILHPSFRFSWTFSRVASAYRVFTVRVRIPNIVAVPLEMLGRMQFHHSSQQMFFFTLHVSANVIDSLSRVFTCGRSLSPI